MPERPGRVSRLTVAMKMCPSTTGATAAATVTWRIHDAIGTPGSQMSSPVTANSG